MDSVVIGSIGAILLLLGVIFWIFNQTPQPEGKSKEQKQSEIIGEYRTKLDEALKGLDGDARQSRKSKLLQGFSAELSRNIFFDDDEMRAAIRELAQ